MPDSLLKFMIFSLFAVVVSGCGSGVGNRKDMQASAGTLRPPGTTAEIIWQKDIGGGRIVKVYREQAVITPHSPTPEKVMPGFLDPFDATFYTFTLHDSQGRMEILCSEMRANEANPSNIEVLDVAVDAKKSRAILVWNKADSTRTVVLAQSAPGGGWVGLPWSPFGAELGPAATAAHAEIDTVNDMAWLALTRKVGEVDYFRSQLTGFWLWQSVK